MSTNIFLTTKIKIWSDVIQQEINISIHDTVYQL